jgi:hypothetical protein
MPVLNTLPKIAAGSTPLVKVCAGATTVWTSTPLAAKLVFPGVGLNYLSATPVASPGDIDIMVRAAPTGWAAGSNANYAAFLSRYGASGVRSFTFRIRLDGFLAFVASVDGISLQTGTNLSSVVVPFTGSTPGWVRTTYVASTALVTFYTAADSPTVPGTWTQLGTTRTLTPVGAAFNPAVTTRWQVGDVTTGSANPYTGRIYRVILKNGIAGTTVLDLSEDDANANISSQFTAAVGGLVTSTVTAGNTIIQPRVP